MTPHDPSLFPPGGGESRHGAVSIRATSSRVCSLRLRNFKNFADGTLSIGPFTVIIGANASGKSNLRDALRFLHGVGRGYTLAEIMGGKLGRGGQVEWDPLRGGAGEMIRFGQASFSLSIAAGPGEYSIEVARNGAQGDFEVIREWFAGTGSPRTPIFTTDLRNGGASEHDRGEGMAICLADHGMPACGDSKVEARRNQPALSQIVDHDEVTGVHRGAAKTMLHALESMRFLELAPDIMRIPSYPGQTVIGNRGENLATALHAICSDPQRRDIVVEWLRAATPMEVEGFEFPVDPTSGRVQLVIRESDNRRVSALAASDGTLRFLAMLAAFFARDRAQLYFCEEVDNGIHPSRVSLLLDLIERRTRETGIQVITTTHSPTLLGGISDEAFRNTFAICRLPRSADAIIRSVAQLPQAAALRKSQGLSDLLASGWMEDAVFFMQDDAERTGDAR